MPFASQMWSDVSAVSMLRCWHPATQMPFETPMWSNINAVSLLRYWHPASPMTLSLPMWSDLNAVSEYTTLPFEVVLDSGAVDHVADNAEAPGYSVESKGRSNLSFSAANGDRIENRGVMIFNLTTTEGHPIKSKFQVCDVSRPLWSVGKICDAGCSVTFDSKGAAVKHSASGKTLCTFERRGGLYLASMPLFKPANTNTPVGESKQVFRRQD